MIADVFIKPYAGAKTVSARKADIFKIAQGDDELLREFVIRFQKECVHNWYESKIWVEDDKFGLPAGTTGRNRNYDRPKRNVDSDSRFGKERYQPYGRPERPRLGTDGSRGNQFKSMKSNSGNDQFISKVTLDPSRRNPNLFCDFHGTRGHRTADCRHLRDKVDQLLKNGHLKEFLDNRSRDGYGKSKGSSRHSDLGKPSHVINMIMEGTEIAGTPLMTKRTKFSITWEKKSQNIVPDEVILFTSEDADDVIIPHNDALVISVIILDCQVKRILIDPGSSVNIIRWKVVDQLSMLDRLIPPSRVINGFNLACKTMRREIILPINEGEMLKHTKFYVIDGDMSCNAIFGRPWIHDIKAVPSTLHFLLKFPIPDGIKQIRSERSAAKERFSIESWEKEEPKHEKIGTFSAKEEEVKK
ncbi:uncharacterized protein LOC132062407 [Lycium ferocissimum]|uniref:uncharacterized protein LOC132062407 n=1 Tax=Lycium ferocissimum TaxID=112874 RepID=UPI00281647B1|nr:uncharacterized protein LOC132062407 [Lycium ferocissimum]